MITAVAQVQINQKRYIEINIWKSGLPNIKIRFWQNTEVEGNFGMSSIWISTNHYQDLKNKAPGWLKSSKHLPLAHILIPES